MLSRIPLIGRVVLALAVVGLLPLLVSFLSLVGANRAAMTLQVLRTHAVAASTVAERIEAVFAGREAILRALAGNPEMSADPTSEPSRNLMRDQLAADARLVSITILTPDGREVLRAQRPGTTPLSWQSRPGRAQLLSNGGNLFLDSSATIEGRGEVLRIISSADEIRDALRPAEIDEEADLALYDSTGTQKATEGTDLAFPAAMIASGRSARVVGSGEYELNGRRFLGAFAPVGTSGWFVLSKQPATVANRLMVDLQRRSLISALLALLLTVILSWAAYRSIVKPIRDLLTVQRASLGEAAPTSGSEIDQLKSTFELLERRVADQKDLGRIFLGRYQVLNVLGEGGMGTVFRGWDPKLQRLVALKTIRIAKTEASQRAEQIEALLREAVTVASLSHSNVVAVYDVENSTDAAYVAMELVDGMSLEEHIASKKKLPQSEVTLIGAAVARGLAAAHSRGIIHQDIKPANVLLGSDGSIKVTDFGISELVSARAAKEKFVFGTPGYIAPERYRGQSGEASDLFSLGVVLYRALTGLRPFERLVVSETIRATMKEEPRPLAEVAPKASAELRRLIEQLLAKDPAERSRSAAAVAEALEEEARRHGYVWTRPDEGRTPSSAERSHAMFAPTLNVTANDVAATER